MADRAYHFPTVSGDARKARDVKVRETIARRARVAGEPVVSECYALICAARAGDKHAQQRCAELYEMPSPRQQRRKARAAQTREAREARAATERREWLERATPWLRPTETKRA